MPDDFQSFTERPDLEPQHPQAVAVVEVCITHQDGRVIHSTYDLLEYQVEAEIREVGTSNGYTECERTGRQTITMEVNGRDQDDA